MTNAGNEGRDDIFKRFAFNSYGTRNFGHHGSYCGYAFRAGSGAFMNDLDKNAHLKPDFDNAEYIIFIGMSPAQAGNPFKRQARQLANARTEGSLEYTIITPSLPAGSSSLAAGDNNRWIPIKPGTDSARAWHDPMDHRKPTLQQNLLGAAGSKRDETSRHRALV